MTKEDRKKVHEAVDVLLDMMLGEDIDGEEEEEIEEEETEISLSDVRKAMREFNKEHGTAAGKKLLKAYGAKSMTDLEEDDYQSVLDDIEEYDG